MTWDNNFDLLEDWRKWPIHAVSGIRVDGRVFTTGRITQLAVVTGSKGSNYTVYVTGAVPRGMLGQTKAIDGRIDYARTFSIRPDEVHIETELFATGQDNFAELYETLPVLLREGPPPTKTPETATTIEFRTAKGPWTTASGEWADGVTAVRLSRFGGAVLVEFDRPRRVKLGDEWSDKYLSRVVCRNVLIDLIEQNDKPAVVREASVSYRLRAEK